MDEDKHLADETRWDLLEKLPESRPEDETEAKELLQDYRDLKLLAAASRVESRQLDVEARLAAFHAGERRRKRLRMWRRGLSWAGVAAVLAGVLMWAWPDMQGGMSNEPVVVFLSDSLAPRHPQLQTEAAKGTTGKKSSARAKAWTQPNPNEIDYHTRQNLEANAQDLPERHSLTVPRGQTFKLTLSDGTEVYMNTDSRLIYPSRFTGKERSVYLEGEAYFHVARDERHPFVVRTSTLETRVLGTEFNVSGYAGSEPEVTLIEGSVEVTGAGRREAIRITPGEQVGLQADGSLSVRKVDVSPYVHWKEGYFYYDDVTLLEIMKDLGRWYNVSIVFCSADAMNARLHYAADRRKDLQHAVTLLNRMNKFKVTLKADGRLYVE